MKEIKNGNFSIRIVQLICGIILQLQCYAQPGLEHKNLTNFNFNKGSVDLFKGGNVSYININHESAAKYQDIKRAIFFLSHKPSNVWLRGVCFLVNTVAQNKKPYMLTSASIFPGKRVSDEINLILMPNNEIPNRENGSTNRSIQSSWSTKAKILVLDRNSDIVLFEILDDTKEYRGLYNAYALGWKIARSSEGSVAANIAFPGNDHKKILLNPVSTSYQNTALRANAPINFKGGKSYTVDWSINGNPVDGSVGSPLLNDQGQVVGLHTGPAVDWNQNPPTIDQSKFLYTALSNSWEYQQKTANEPAGLIDYLDPDDMWVTEIPGGYWADLNTVNATLTHDVPTGTRLQLVTNYDLGWKDLNQNQLRVDNEPPFPPYGIKVDGALNNKELLLYATTTLGNEEFLAWGVKAEGSSVTNQGGFRGDAIDTAFPTLDADFNALKLPNDNTRYRLSTNDLKQALILLGARESRVTGQLTDLPDFSLPVNIYMSRDDIDPSPLPVTAWGIPGKIPQNLKQTRTPAVVENAFDFEKYQRLEVQSNSASIYLNYFNIYQKIRFAPISKLRIIGGGGRTPESNYYSGNNGGYLNMVNPLTHIGVECSYIDENVELTERKINVKLVVPAACYFKVWIDYNKDFSFSGDFQGTNELILQGQIPVAGEHIVEYVVPQYVELGIEAGKSKAYHMRVAVSTTAPPMDGAGVMPDGEVEDYLIVLSSPDDQDLLKRKAKVALNSERIRNRKVQRPAGDHTNPGNQNNNAPDNLLYAQLPQGNNQGNAHALTTQLVDNGSLPSTFNPLLVRMEDMLTLAYQAMGSAGDSDPDDDFIPGEGCPNDPVPDNDPFPGFDPADAAAWQYWAEFNSLYNNVARIIRFWDNLKTGQGGALVPFIVDPDGTIDWSLWEAFVDAYNSLATFKNLIDGTTSVYDLLYLVYNNDDLMTEAFGSDNVSLFRDLFDYILKFQCFKDQLLDLADINQSPLNLTDNLSKIALDWWGEVIPDNLNGRTLVSDFTLTDYPEPNHTSVIYHAKGEANATILGVNSTGQLTYTLKVGNEEKTITSTNSVPLNERLLATIRFTNGEMSVYLNATEEGTDQIAATSFGYQNYTDLNNGARIGAPIHNYTDPTVNTGLQALDAVIHEVLFYDEALDDNSIDLLADGNQTSSGNQTNARVVDEGSKQGEELQELSDLNIYPNSSDGAFNISFEAADDDFLSVRITSLEGKIIYQDAIATIQEGQQVIGLDLRNELSPGIYIVHLTTSRGAINSKIIVE